MPGCTLRLLPPYSPDYTPIEQTFTKLKAMLRKAGKRTMDGTRELLGQAIDAYGPE
jgi:transposase